MKTRINLYLPQLRPVKEVLSLKQSLSYIFACIVIVIVVITSLSYMCVQIESKNTQLRKTLMVEQNILTDKVNELAAVTVNTPLLKDIELVKIKIVEKKKVLAVLKNEFEDNIGYSAIFSGLTSIEMNDIWLTRIASKQGQLNFSGSALRSRDIPRWVNTLESSSVFGGLKFSHLDIKRQDKILKFTLSNSSDYLNGDK